MDLTPVMGNVPEWISVGLAGYALHRTTRAEHFFEELQKAGLDAEKIARAVEETERFGDLLVEAAEVAVQCPDEQRRVLLARAYASGIEGDVTIDDLQFFIRTMRQVEPLHMKLLRAMTERGAVSTGELEQLWPEALDLLSPICSALEGEGLIKETAVATVGGGGSIWNATPYGRRFIGFAVDCDAAIDWLPVRQ